MTKKDLIESVSQKAKLSKKSREIREQLEVLANRLDADEQRIITLEQKVDALETTTATTQGNQTGGRDILTLILSALAVVISAMAMIIGL